MINLATTSEGGFDRKAKSSAKILSQDNFKATQTDDRSLLIEYSNYNSLLDQDKKESFLMKD